MAQNLVIGSVTYNGVESMEMTNAAGEKIVYVEKVNAGTGEYVAQIGEKKFYTVDNALAEAADGDAVVLLMNVVEVETLIIKPGVTLDLNGQTLTAPVVVGLDGSHLVDRSTGKTGLLVTQKNSVKLSKNNEQMPVYNGVDGYVFTAIPLYNKKNSTTSAGKNKRLQQPVFEPVAHPFIAAGYATSGIRIVDRLSYLSDPPRVEERTYIDSLVKQVTESYNPTTGKYAKAYSFTYDPPTEDYIITSAVISDTGVEIATTS